MYLRISGRISVLSKHHTVFLFCQYQQNENTDIPYIYYNYLVADELNLVADQFFDVLSVPVDDEQYSKNNPCAAPEWVPAFGHGGAS